MNFLKFLVALLLIHISIASDNGNPLAYRGDEDHEFNIGNDPEYQNVEQPPNQEDYTDPFVQENHQTTTQTPNGGSSTHPGALREQQQTPRNLRPSDYCRPSNDGNYHFPRTRFGSIASSRETCGKTGLPQATALCTDGEDARFPMFVSRRFNCDSTLHSVLNEAEDEMRLVERLDRILFSLQIVTSNRSMRFLPSRIEGIVNLFDRIQRFARNRLLKIAARTNLPFIIATLSQISRSYTPDFEDNDEGDGEYHLIPGLRRRTARILPSLCLLSQFSQNQTRWATETEELQMQAIDVSDDMDIEYSAQMETNENETTSPSISVFVPSSVVSHARGQTYSNGESGNMTIRTVFIYYRDAVLFPSNETVLNILSVNVGSNESVNANLTNPVIMRHRNLTMQEGKRPIPGRKLVVNQTTFECVFWNFNSSDWSSEGCEYVDKECRCYHLTNFALLVLVRGCKLDDHTRYSGTWTLWSLTASHQKGITNTDVVRADYALEVVSLIGCVLSIVGLIITIIIFLLQRELRKYRPGKILLHLCCNLCIAYVIFVSGVSNAIGNPAACAAVTFLLHYFFLVSWAWMGVYSYEIYVALVKVFQSHQSQFMVKTSAACYVGSLLVVSLTFGLKVGLAEQTTSSVSPNLTAYFVEHACWLREQALYYGFLLPVGLILLANFVVFILVTYELSKQNNTNAESKPKRSTKDSISIAITMTVVMGLTWAFGYLTIITADETFFVVASWLFAIFNTIQGLLIFLLTVVRREDSRKLLWKPFQRCCDFEVHKRGFLQSTSASPTSPNTTSSQITSPRSKPWDNSKTDVVTTES